MLLRNIAVLEKDEAIKIWDELNIDTMELKTYDIYGALEDYSFAYNKQVMPLETEIEHCSNMSEWLDDKKPEVTKYHEWYEVDGYKLTRYKVL